MSLDIEQPAELVDYLRSSGRVGPTEEVRTRVLAGGVSNRTVLVELPDRPGREAWVLKQALAKLRVTVDWFSDPARIGREASGLRYLSTLAPPGTITPLVFEDPSNHLLAMAAVPEPHENWKSRLMARRVEPEYARQFGSLLGGIHRRSGGAEAGGADPQLAAAFADTTFFESLRVEPYYRYTASAVPESADFYGLLIADLKFMKFTLVHGDYSPKNILIHQGRLVLLDHEVIHWGDPLFDAGFAMAHLLSKAHHLASARARLRVAALQFALSYVRALGDVYWLVLGFQRRWVDHTLGCLLARVAGRSPLEYLSPAQRDRQKRVVLRLMCQPPENVAALIERFLEGVSFDADD